MSQRAAAEPTVTEFETALERVDGREVVLETTYFYAESGGQPADRGTIGEHLVADVQKRDGEVVHILDEEPAFEPGETVIGAIDAEFRTYCRRAHTASHVLYGAGRRLLEDLGYGGFDISPEKVRVDLSTPSDVDDETLVELERLTNRAVWDSRPVAWEEVPQEEALEREDVAFNTATEEGVMAGTDAVRIVEVEGWDVAACGGTHVENTREIGPVTVLDRSNPGEGLTRVEFAVGPVAIDRRSEARRAALDAAREAGTSVGNLPDEVERLQSEIGDLEDEIADLNDRLVETTIADLREETVEKGSVTWLVGAVGGLDSNALGDRVRELAGDAADVVVLAGESGGTFVVAGADGDADASSVIDDVTAEFGGGGGGSSSFAQGGGLSADPDDVVAYLRER
jgi:alanyl-tRNA synthetase